MIIEGEKGKYEIVIGIEVHAQLSSNTKLFSTTRATSGEEINSDVSLFDIAMPGNMPILNEFVLNQAIKTGLGLNAIVNTTSIFDRKHYFYPDLPAGYQITQFYRPIIQDGFLTIDLADGTEKKIRINRAHLEQDAGKLMHDLIPGATVVDLNRSGVPLLEIVSEPDIKSPYEAAQYIKNLRAILRALGTSSADMEKGEMRCDINISVMKEGSKTFGSRCEIKNVNSVKHASHAIEYEAKRQVQEIEEGRPIVCETRLFDAASGVTKSMRIKESAADYRYIPEPDLLPVIIENEVIEKIKSEMPEMPRAKFTRYKSELGLSAFECEVITSDNEIIKYFEKLISLNGSPKLCATWLIGELFERMNKACLSIESCPISPEKLSALLNLIQNQTISGKIAKEVLNIMFEGSDHPEEIVLSRGLSQITNEAELSVVIEQTLSENQDKVLEYKSGKTKLLDLFTGKIMKATSGRASPTILNRLLLEKLKS